MNVRKQYIIDMIAHYKKNYREEYDDFMEQLKERREGMSDKEIGYLRGEHEIRLAISLPDRLYRMLDIAFIEEDKKFLEDTGEMKWFCNKFKQFLLPNNL